MATKGQVPVTADDWFRVWNQAARWERAVDAVLAPKKLGHTRYMLLDLTDRLVKQNDDAISQRTLVEATGLREPAVSRAVAALVRDGLIDMDVSGVDGRRLRLLVTAAGRRMLQQLRPMLDSVAAQLAAAR